MESTPLEIAARFRERAKEMLRAAELIEEEAKGLSSQNGQITRKRRKGKAEKKPTKRERDLLKFLSANGPSTFTEIKDRSGIPAGTVSTLLRKSRFVKQNDDKQWEPIKGQA